MNPNLISRLAGFSIALGFALTGMLPGLRADPLPNPIITAAARSFNASFTAANVLDNNAASEFATLGQGAVSVPFTTDPNNGTWIQFDFGTTVTFDRFVMTARNNTVDVIAESRLVVSVDPTFDGTDTIVTFNPSGFNGAGIVQNFNAVSGRYVRWEVTSRGSSGLNLGAAEIQFLTTPAGNTVLPAPAVINSSPPFSATYAAAYAVDGDAGRTDKTHDYASAGAGAGMFIDFDFGQARALSGFDFWNRPGDRVTTFNLIFADTADFSAPITTMSFTADANGLKVSSATFAAAVTARYVRFQATGFAGGVNTGVREIQFYFQGTLPPSVLQQPQGGTRLVGDSFTFAVQAGGSAPLSYQWRHGAADVPNATNTTFTLSNLLTTEAGDYTVVITNPAGSVTSAPPATLSVLDPPLDTISDLRLWLKFDETFGPVAVDDSGNLRDATLSGFPGDDFQWVTGRIDGALLLNPDGGVGDDVALVADDGGLNFSSAPAFTLATWVNGPALQEAGGAILAKGTGGGGEQFALDINASAYRFFVRNAAGVASVYQATNRPNDTWQHLAVVFSSALGRVKVYVNGEEVLNATPPPTLLANSHEVSIGSRQLGSGAYDLNFSGKLDDLRIYGRALTTRDVVELYNQAALIPPHIVMQPAGGTFLAYDAVTLTGAADGSPLLAYQWLKDSAPVANATNASLTLPSVSTNDAGNYRLRVTNAVGSATSDVAVVTVNDPPPALVSGLALHLKLDETSGSKAADSSGFDRHGTLQGFADSIWAAGIIDGALNFNPDGGAGDDVVLVSDDGGLDFSASLEFSLSAWVNGDSAQEAGGALICKGTGGGGEQFCLDAVPAFRFFGWTGAQPPLYALQSSISPGNTWQHVAAVFSRPANRLKLYLNGVEVASGAPPATILPSSHDVSIGSRQLGSTAGAPYDLNLKGVLDDVRIYNRPLTPREVRGLHELGHAPRLTITLAGGSVTITWPLSATGYALESSAVLPASTWNTVSGVVNNSVTLPAGPGTRFFRLQKP